MTDARDVPKNRWLLYVTSEESMSVSNSKISSKVVKVVKKLILQLKETDLDHMDLISTLVF